MKPDALMLIAAVIVALLGTLHLIYTFVGIKLLPRNRMLVEQMKSTTMVITPHTTVWNAWIGFNATHSLGAIAFGALYAYLATVHPQLLFDSNFLLALAVVWLGSYLAVALRYFFRVPTTGIALALASTIGAIAVARIG
jgi:hypothetical protein